MANICDTQYKVTGSRKAVADLWNTLQELEVNSNNPKSAIRKFCFHFILKLNERCILC